MSNLATTTTTTTTPTKKTTTTKTEPPEEMNEGDKLPAGAAAAAAAAAASAATSSTEDDTILSKKEDDDDDDDDYFSDLGFMFEGNQPVQVERLEWNVPNNNNNNNSTESIRVTVHAVLDDHPGALQSGHYLWPGARLLANYLVEHASNHHNHNNIAAVIELGAGCALASLTALQLYADSNLQCVLVTDHDPGTLVRATDNHETTLQDMVDLALNSNTNDDNNNNNNNNNDNNDETKSEFDALEDSLNCIINTTTSIPVLFEVLEWGESERSVQKLLNLMMDHVVVLAPTNTNNDSDNNNINNSSFRSNQSSPSRHFLYSSSSQQQPQQQQQPNHWLILGSDVIYDKTVIRPLLQTVWYFITNIQAMDEDSTCTFLLASASIPWTDEIETELQQVCQELHFQTSQVTLPQQQQQQEQQEEKCNTVNETTNIQSTPQERILQFTLKND